MLDVASEFAAPMLLSNLNAGVVYPRLAAHHHALAPYGAFRCGDGTEILIAVHQDAEWKRLCATLLGDPALGDDPRFATTLDRVANRDVVAGIVGEALGALDHAAAVSALEDAGIAHARVNGMAELAAHDVIRRRGVTTQVSRDGGRSVSAFVGIAERLFDPDGDRDSRPPMLDEHALAPLGTGAPHSGQGTA